MSDETLTFNSEEERLEAINAVDEKAEGAIEKLNEIQNAEIVEKEPEAVSEEPEETPAKEEKEDKPEPTPETPEEKAVEKEAEAPTEEGKKFTINSEDLPEGYDTPGKAFKTLVHQAEYIKRLKEEQEAQMEALRQKYESKPPPEPVQEPSQQASSYDAQINEIEAKIKKQYEDDPLNPEIATLQSQLVDVKAKAIVEARAAEIEQKATGMFEEYRQTEEQKRIDELNRETIKKDYQEFDELGKNKEYSEYKMSKPADEVEKDFLMLRDEITKAYYGRPAQSWAEVNNALYQYNNHAPTLMQALQAMNIPTEYPKDVLTFLELQKLLNDRDGVKYNENGEQVVWRKRWDPLKGDYVPDRFPDLKATIESQRVNSGYYKDKELSAYDKGRKDTLAARSRRDHNELQDNDGRDGSAETSIEQINAEIAALPNSPDSLPKLAELQNKLAELAGETR